MTRGAELLRKALHVGMGAAALLLRWLDPLEAALLALAALLFNLTLLHRLTAGRLLRGEERPRAFSAGVALYPVMLLATVAVGFRRLDLVAAVWGLLAVGDGMAAVCGLLIGGPRLPWNPRKTWAGLVGFVLYGTAAAAFLLRWTQRGVLDVPAHAAWTSAAFLSDASGLLAGCAAAALAAGLAESAATRLDDNVVVPVVGGAVLWIASLVDPALLAGAGLLDPQRLASGAGIGAALAALAWAVGAATPAGAVVGWILAAALYGAAGGAGLLVLSVVVATTTAATRAGRRRKRALGLAQTHGGRRGPAHVLANLGVAVVAALLARITPYRGACEVAFVAALASAACDTVATELGQAWGRRPVSLPTLRRVAAGTPGAISLVGTLAGLVAAGLVGLAAGAAGTVGADAALVAITAAFAAVVVESIAGATLALGHHARNLGNTALGALLAVLAFGLLG